MTATEPVISVCIVSRGPGPRLTACLKSLLEQDGPPPFELLVGSRRLPEIEQEVLAFFPQARLIDAPHSFPGGGRNLLIEQACAELLLFLDDDVVAHQLLLARLDDLSRQMPEVGVFGGPNLTPAASTRFQVVQGAVLGSIVTSGPIRRRYGRHPSGAADERSLILCNLAIRRSAMRPFEADLACAEENKLLVELKRQGVEMHYDNDLVVFHERRDSCAGFARQIYKYGYGRGQVIRRDPKSLRVAYLAPSATMTYLAAAPLLALLSPWALAPALLYLLAVAAGGAKVAVSMRRAGTWLPAGALIALVHACYGLGLIAGAAAPVHRRPVVRRKAAAEPQSRTYETTDI